MVSFIQARPLVAAIVDVFIWSEAEENQVMGQMNKHERRGHSIFTPVRKHFSGLCGDKHHV